MDGQNTLEIPRLLKREKLDGKTAIMFAQDAWNEGRLHDAYRLVDIAFSIFDKAAAGTGPN